MKFTIYHNPKCSKSRQTLAILTDNTAQIDVVEYLTTPPTAQQLTQWLQTMDMQPRDLMRKKEHEYTQLNLNDNSLSDSQLIDAMVAHPKLIERPIVVHGEQVVIGRPPENVLRFFPHTEESS